MSTTIQVQVVKHRAGGPLSLWCDAEVIEWGPERKLEILDGEMGAVVNDYTRTRPQRIRFTKDAARSMRSLGIYCPRNREDNCRESPWRIPRN